MMEVARFWANVKVSADVCPRTNQRKKGSEAMGEAATKETEQTDYTRFRGKCREMVEDLCSENPELTPVRGHYYCPIWNSEEAHWWAVDKNGKIHDPSSRQFPSNGLGIYTPFDGMCTCSNCGKSIREEDGHFDSNYVFCSNLCHGRFVGVY